MTREEVLCELEHTEKDLQTFKKAMDAFSERKLELEGEPARRRMFMDWPAVQATLNVLIMGITRCEGMIEDYRRLLETMELPDNVVTLERKDV
jgi:hypothetical protein